MQQIQCAKCNKEISRDPGSRRRYCSDKCRHAMNWEYKKARAKQVARSECECGGALPCRRCDYLDGSRADGQVISTLRTTPGLSVPEIAMSLGRATRAVYRQINSLLEKGRIYRVSTVISTGQEKVEYHLKEGERHG
jgi:predicted transcriptional regulator